MKRILLCSSALSLAAGTLFANDLMASSYGDFRSPHTESEEGFNLPPGASKELVDAHSVCRWVSNNHSHSAWVPLKTPDEWASYVSRAPSHLPREGCCIPTTLSLCGESFNLGYGHTGHGPYSVSAGYSKTADIVCNGVGWSMANEAGECEPPPPPPPPGGFGGGGGGGDASPSHDSDGDGTTDTAGFGGGGYSNSGIGSSAHGGTGGSSGGCFVAGTRVTMEDGSAKAVEDIDVGDVVAYGGRVMATAVFLITELYSYRDVKVSGDHVVWDNGRWKRVKDCQAAIKVSDEEVKVYVHMNEHHMILIDGILFADFAETDDWLENWEDAQFDRIAAMNARDAVVEKTHERATV